MTVKKFIPPGPFPGLKYEQEAMFIMSLLGDRNAATSDEVGIALRCLDRVMNGTVIRVEVPEMLMTQEEIDAEFAELGR